MEGEEYMQKITVNLQEIDGQDVMIFDVTPPLTVNFSNENSQTDLKNIFSSLLNLLIGDDLEVDLKVQDGYSRSLFIEVAQEYIRELNKELNQTRIRIVKEFQMET